MATLFRQETVVVPSVVLVVVPLLLDQTLTLWSSTRASTRDEHLGAGRVLTRKFQILGWFPWVVLMFIPLPPHRELDLQP